MRKAHGMIHLPALPAQDVWHAWSRLTLYAAEPLSTVTVGLDAGGLRTGNVAGLAISGGFFAWLGVERVDEDLTLAQFDVQSAKTSRVALGNRRVWLRAACDFVGRQAAFSYSTDGSAFAAAGGPCPTGECFVLTTERAPRLNGSG